METDCENEINEKESHDKKDLIQSNEENVEERKNDLNTEERKDDVIQASDMDKMLEDCNRYLNECEEVLQDCAKYLDECEDTEDLSGDEGECNNIDDGASISTGPERDKELNVNRDISSPKQQRKIAKEKLGVSEKEHIENNPEDVHSACVHDTDTNKEIPDKINVIEEKNETTVMNDVDSTDSVKDDTLIVEGNETTVINDTVSQDAVEAHDSVTSIVDGNETTNIIDTNSKDTTEAHGNDTSIDKEKSRDDSIKVTLDHLEIDSDDSMDSDEEQSNLVPLQIQEDCDDTTEEYKINTKNPSDSDVTDVDAEGNKMDVNMKEDNSADLEKLCESADSDHVMPNKVLSIEISGKVNIVENDEKITSEIKECEAGALNKCNPMEVDGNDLQASQQKEENFQLKANENGMESSASSVKTEMKALQEELSATKVALKSSQGHLVEQQTKSNNLIMTLKLDLYKTQTALKQERLKSHQQLSEVISHLTLLEGNLRKGQLKHRAQLKQRNETIETQKKEILKLKDQNEQLLNAIKEIYANGGMNGYMREKHSEKKGHNGKLGMVKDKFLMKNRSSLELNNFNLEKYNLKNQRLCSSQEDLKNLNDDAFDQNSPNHEKGSLFGRARGSSTRGSKYGKKNHRKNLQNFFTEPETPKHEINKTVGDSPQISESSSGVFSMSDQEYSRQSYTNMNGHFDDEEDDDDDGRIFSFSSTHINTVIDEEEALGPIISHSGQLMSMASMPMLAQSCEDPGQRIYSSKDRPHSLSSVDLISIQRQAEKLSHVKPSETISESCTPPPSPSYNNNNNKSETGKSEMTPFQTFKTMFKRKGSKNKGNKKRPASLSQTTNTEYSEALKKHFQKYDMH